MHDHTQRRNLLMPIALLALALGGFGIGLTEFVIAGLLPQVAADFTVDEATAGWLISGYALSVAVGAIGLTAAVTRFNRKHVLTALMVLFIAGNLVSALAGSYEVMLLGRILAALTHGAFFGIGAVVAAGLVAPEKKAGAIAMMFAGLTTANVLGVPLGTLLGQQLGWRSTFWAITEIGVVALVGMATLVPSQPVAAGEPGLRSELGAFRSGQVWLSLLVTVLGFGGMFGPSPTSPTRSPRSAASPPRPCRGCSCCSGSGSSPATGWGVVPPTGPCRSPSRSCSPRSPWSWACSP